VGKKQLRNGPPINIAIIETDPLRLAGLRALLESQEDLQLTSFSMAEFAGATDIDLVILGKRHGESLSLVMHHLKAAQPDARVIVTAPETTDGAILEALVIGVKGYLHEAAPASEFVQAIRTVNQGLVWAPRRVLAMFVDRSCLASRKALGRPQFTAREKEVLEMLVEGLSNKDISGPLGIAERTVKAHVAKLMRKVGVHNRITLSVHAIAHNLVASR
jgi:DNA-binding NarL/FixJ family response regulator